VLASLADDVIVVAGSAGVREVAGRGRRGCWARRCGEDPGGRRWPAQDHGSARRDDGLSGSWRGG